MGLHERQAGHGSTIDLARLLERACGSAQAAESLLRYALVRAGLARVPDAPDDVLGFVRAHLLGPLSRDVGPRLAMALVDELIEQGEPVPASGVELPRSPSSSAQRVALSVRSSGQPAKGRILVVDTDSLRRASLARVLVQARWDVRLAESADQVREAAAAEEYPDVVLVDLDHPAVDGVLRTIAAVLSDAAIVLRGDAKETKDHLSILGRARLCPRDTSELAMIEEVVGGLGRE